jgi:membrane protease subunit (stomatin/prohibitin family)
MGLGSFIKKQFIDVLQWNEDQEGVLAWRFPMQDFEIQNGAALTVRESQMAVFVNEGKIADVFGPGNHKLTTRTLPLLTNLKNWDKLFDSPFKSDVVFFSTRIQTGRKWGTMQPITVRDKDFDMIRVRAFGMYSYKIANPAKFYVEISGSREIYTREDIEDQLRGIMVANIASALGNSGVPFLDMAANQEMMGQHVKRQLAEAFMQYGLQLDQFNIANLNLPEELQKALDERISAGMKGGMSADKLRGFTQFQVASSIPLAAQNEGGLAGLGAGLSSGMAFGQIMAQGMAGQMAPQMAPPPAPQAAPPAPEDDVEARLTKLKGLADRGLISATDYETAKADLLKKLIG